MKCHECKYYKSGQFENECTLTGNYCFKTYYKDDCIADQKIELGDLFKDRNDNYYMVNEIDGLLRLIDQTTNKTLSDIEITNCKFYEIEDILSDFGLAYVKKYIFSIKEVV